MKTQDTSKIEKKVALRISEDTLEKLRQLAKDHQRSLNSEIIWGLQLYITENKKKGAE